MRDKMTAKVDKTRSEISYHHKCFERENFDSLIVWETTAVNENSWSNIGYILSSSGKITS